MKVEFTTPTVEYLYKTGEDFVKATMSKEDAEAIIAKGKVEDSKVEGYAVKVGDYYFNTTDTFKSNAFKTKKESKKNEI